MDAVSESVDVRTLDLLSDGVIIYSTEDGARLLHANRAALQICDCETFEDMLSFCQGDFLNFFHPEDYRHHIDTIKLSWGADDSFEHHAQYRIVTKKNNIKLINDTGRVISIPGHARCYICVLTAMDRQISYASDSSDPLTGLLSMGQFVQYSESFLKTVGSRPGAGQYRIAYFNIRKFKAYNLEHGISKGDQVLKGVADIISEVFSQGITGRIGADQFVAISDADGMARTAMEVVDEFSRRYAAFGLELKVGIYSIVDYNQSIHKAYSLAKVACDSIRDTKVRLRVYDSALAQKFETEKYVTQHLDEAIANRYIRVYFQPVIRTLNGAVCGVEALARWIDPQVGFLSPADFIPALEENALIAKLDLHMLREICREMVEAYRKGEPLVPVSFNLSRCDFQECDCFAEVDKIVTEYGVPRDMINIEITESTIMDDPAAFRAEINRFRSGGYQVWMDDFGSGYSSLNVLKDFKFDEIKLDMKFLSAFDDDSKSIIESMVLMAKKLGIQTLAEGVETAEQLAFLREIGCEKAQGYLISKPAPLSELRKLGAERHAQIERREWRSYYDRIGSTNFITDRALSIVEYDGKDFTHLFVNQAFEDVWASLGINGVEMIEESINLSSSPLSRQFRDVQATLHVGDAPQDVIYTIRGQYVRLSAECMAEHAGRFAYDVQITNLSDGESGRKRERLDSIFHMMYALFDSIYLLDTDTGRLEMLMKGASSNMLAFKAFRGQGSIDLTDVEEGLIHPSDREDYRRFSDATTRMKRLKKTKKGYLTEYFRTKTDDGAYVWKAHTMLYVPEEKSVIYCTRHAFFNRPGLIERIAPDYLARQ